MAADWVITSPVERVDGGAIRYDDADGLFARPLTTSIVSRLSR